MPALYRDIDKKVQELYAAECSRCGKRVEREDVIEFQEFLFWRNIGGYGSIWGDGTVVEVDLCQYCTYELFNSFATVHEK